MQYYYTGTNGYKKLRSSLMLGKHESTICRELKRGRAEYLKSDLNTMWKYCAEYAQRDAEEKGSAKRPELKLGYDWALVERMTHLVRDEEYSPNAIIAEFNNNGWPSEKTLYNYIQAGYMGELTEKNLLYGGKQHKPKGVPRPSGRSSMCSRGSLGR